MLAAEKIDEEAVREMLERFENGEVYEDLGTIHLEKSGMAAATLRDEDGEAIAMSGCHTSISSAVAELFQQIRGIEKEEVEAADVPEQWKQTVEE